MNFEEQFPSLLNSFVDKDDRIHKLSIMNHCLDKKKVKDAYYNLREFIENAHILTPETYKKFDEFKTKLGLE